MFNIWNEIVILVRRVQGKTISIISCNVPLQDENISSCRDLFRMVGHLKFLFQHSNTNEHGIVSKNCYNKHISKGELSEF